MDANRAVGLMRKSSSVWALERVPNKHRMIWLKAKPKSLFPEAPKPPKKLTPESMARYKGALREYDSKHLAAGVPAAVIQKENSFFPSGAKISITGNCTVPDTVLRLIAAQEPMSPDNLGKLTHRLAKSKSRVGSAKLTKKITRGFYATAPAAAPPTRDESLDLSVRLAIASGSRRRRG